MKSIPLTQRFERKFFIIPRNQGMAYALLRQVCRPDREYPDCEVHSLYFDTPELEQYYRSQSGEFLKNKVRIRWYDEIAESYTTVFLELKSRRGFASFKQRLPFEVPSPQLDTKCLSRGILDKSVIINTLASFGYFIEKPLIPVILISYRRYRFNEISTGIRVSFDYNIKARAVSLALGPHDHQIQLPGGVIEVKGPNLELPFTLRRMRLLDTDWSRFSKYGNCIDACLSTPGSISRFWPSGRMNEI